MSDQDSIVGVETCCGLVGLEFELWLWVSRLALHPTQPSVLLILIVWPWHVIGQPSPFTFIN